MNPIPLSWLPSELRPAEIRARAGSTDTSGYTIVLRPGCHGQPPTDPPIIGWVETREAAEHLARRTTRMPNHTSHRRLAFRRVGELGTGEWPADAPTCP